MADAICRWRNPYIDTVRELIELLPKTELPKTQARAIVIAKSPYDFYRTPYQLACQLGLYHETNGFFYPKFKSTPTDDELNAYLENWIVHYSAPNPYTKKLPNEVQPFSIHSKICQKLIESQNSLNWDSVLFELFGIEIGNKDILKNSFKYSPVFEVVGNVIKLKSGVSYSDLSPFLNVDINSNRENKEYFFDLFEAVPMNTLSNELASSEIITDITKGEKELINRLQSSNEYTQTEKNQIVKARIGQGFFRRSLIEDSPFCPITLVDDINLLIASHIKPWSSSNNTERLDCKNGLLLTPTYDKLFDRGYISFKEDKTLIISSDLAFRNKVRLGLTPNVKISHLPIEGRENYLEYHREHIFRV